MDGSGVFDAGGRVISNRPIAQLAVATLAITIGVIAWAADPYQTVNVDTVHQTYRSAADKPVSEWWEVHWSAVLAEQTNGTPEYRLPNGSRIDILTDDVAWEVEWTQKYPEAVGQALFYATATNREPGIWLLHRPGNDEDYLECLAVVTKLRGHGINMHLRVQTVPAKR